MVFSAINLTTHATNSGPDIFKNLHGIGVGNLILALGGLLPGYYVSLYFIDKWGRKPIQLLGFVALTILFIIMSASFDTLQNPNFSAGPKIFLFLYCLANFFQNFGPNTTTFIIPGELFPTRFRSTAHGISTASGKFGAIIAQIVFTFAGQGDVNDGALGGTCAEPNSKRVRNL